MTTYNCTTANFATNWALRAAGDTYILADGSYGSFTIFTATYSPRITIEAENRYGAVFSSVATSGNVSGINFTGLNLGTSPDFHSPGQMSNCTFEWCRSSGYFRGNFTINVTARYHYHTGSSFAFDDSEGAVIDECCIHNISDGTDGVRFYRASSPTITNSVIFDLSAPPSETDIHPDAIQAALTDNSVCRGNIIFDDTSTVINPTNPRSLQGAFWGDGPHVDAIIEQNMIKCGNANGIRLSTAQGSSVIRNNSLIGTQILGNDQVVSLPITDNISTGILFTGTDNTVRTGNVIYSDPATVYEDSSGLDWTAFETVSEYSTKGAATRYAEILAGTNVEAINLAIDVGGISFTAPGAGEPPAEVFSPMMIAGSPLVIAGSVIGFETAP